MPKTELFNREEILHKCADLFHRKGYNATSMQDLVDTTSLNRSSLYNSFGNKRGIYVESLKFYKDKSSQSIQSFLLDSKTPLSALEAIFNYAVNSGKDGCLLSNCATEMANLDEGIKRFLEHNGDQMEELFETIVKKGQLNGNINYKRTAKEYATYLFSALQGIRVTSMITDNRSKLDSLVKTTLSILY